MPISLDQAMAMFNQNTQLAIQQYQKTSQQAAVRNALATAQDQLNSAEFQALKDGQKKAQAQAIANQLTRDMIGVGADANDIQLAAQSVYKPQAPIQSIDQGLMSDDPEVRKRAMEVQKQQDQHELQMIDRRSSMAMMKEGRQALGTASRDYNKAVATIRESVTNAENAMAILKSGGDVAKMSTSVIPAMLARAAGERGNLTETEKAAYNGMQSIIARIRQELNTKAFSEMTPENQKALMAVVNVYLKQGEKIRNELGDTYVRQLDPYHDALGGAKYIKRVITGVIDDSEPSVKNINSANTDVGFRFK